MQVNNDTDLYRYLQENNPDILNNILSSEKLCKVINVDYFKDNYKYILNSKLYNQDTALNIIKKIYLVEGAENINEDIFQMFFKHISCEGVASELYKFAPNNIAVKSAILSQGNLEEISPEDFYSILKYRIENKDNTSFKIENIMTDIIRDIEYLILCDNYISMDIFIKNKDFIFDILDQFKNNAIEQNKSELLDSFFEKIYKGMERVFLKNFNDYDKDYDLFNFMKEIAGRYDIADCFVLTLFSFKFEDISKYDLTLPAESLEKIKYPYHKKQRYFYETLTYKEVCRQNKLYDTSDVIMIYAGLPGNNEKKIFEIKRLFRYTNIEYTDIMKLFP